MHLVVFNYIDWYILIYIYFIIIFVWLLNVRLFFSSLVYFLSLKFSSIECRSTPPPRSRLLSSPSQPINPWPSTYSKLSLCDAIARAEWLCSEYSRCKIWSLLSMEMNGACKWLRFPYYFHCAIHCVAEESLLMRDDSSLDAFMHETPRRLAKFSLLGADFSTADHCTPELSQACM